MRLYMDKRMIVRQLVLIVYDAGSIIAISLFSLLIKYEFNLQQVDSQYLHYIWRYLPINLITTLIIFYLFRLYHSLWEFAGLNEITNILEAGIFASVLQWIGSYYVMQYCMPWSFYFLYMFFLILTISFGRFSFRYLRLIRRKKRLATYGVPTMIIGAGCAGNVIVREIINSKHITMKPCCFIDDDTRKIGTFIHGVKVVGDRSKIITYVKKMNIDLIIIAMPSAKKTVIRDILTICKETKCELKILPGVYQFMNGEVKVSDLRKVNILDLLGREPITPNLDKILNYVSGKVVLITGGGGSIGSELCRQVARNNPQKLIIVDIYENNAYDIQQELLHDYPKLDLVVLIASVRNTARMNSIFEQYHPNIVYHAAAHKHVPLMEQSPNEAIKNNVFGTLKTVIAADRYGVERFVLISTDKAVNPTNIMGASKRICEMIIQTYNTISKTEYVAVRFGNVLGSNGSVIPLFQKQIEQGGPVMVTHPDIIRYFMTIPEAVSLVLEAGAKAKGGEIFVLDMGEPVKILDLARNLIRLSGLTPEEDIKIEFTGLRPGEKLYEELLLKEEGLQQTENELIYIGKPLEIDTKQFLHKLDLLKEAVEQEPDNIRYQIKDIVPTYQYEKTPERKDMVYKTA